LQSLDGSSTCSNLMLQALPSCLHTGQAFRIQVLQTAGMQVYLKTAVTLRQLSPGAIANSTCWFTRCLSLKRFCARLLLSAAVVFRSACWRAAEGRRVPVVQARVCAADVFCRGKLLRSASAVVGTNVCSSSCKQPDEAAAASSSKSPKKSKSPSGNTQDNTSRDPLHVMWPCVRRVVGKVTTMHCRASCTDDDLT